MLISYIYIYIYLILVSSLSGSRFYIKLCHQNNCFFQPMPNFLVRSDILWQREQFSKTVCIFYINHLINKKNLKMNDYIGFIFFINSFIFFKEAIVLLMTFVILILISTVEIELLLTLNFLQSSNRICCTFKFKSIWKNKLSSYSLTHSPSMVGKTNKISDIIKKQRLK